MILLANLMSPHFNESWKENDWENYLKCVKTFIGIHIHPFNNMIFME